ncbi:MAG: MFS transporter [Rhodobiaceae bacterium]|nr:MAG: MFS transporter [Rhodobiaceae bacterium]
MSSEEKLPRWRVALFSLPAIPISALGLPIVVYLPPFYVADMGLSLTLVGTIFMVARFWDIFTDPVLGILSDRFPSRWGRRRHWIVLSAPILMIASYMLFMPGDPLSGMALFSWINGLWSILGTTTTPDTASYLFGWMVILYIGWTLITISHMSWGAELSQDYDERSVIQGWREFALIFGMFTVLALPAIIEWVQGDAGGRERVAAMGWFILILLPITIFLAVWLVPERAHKTQTQFDVREAWKILLSNRLLQRVLVADLLVGVGPAITGSLYIFFATYVMGLPQYASLLLLIYFVAGFAGIPAWIKLATVTGKHRTLAYAMIYGALSLPLVLFFPRESFWWLLFGNTAYGIAYGAGSFLLRSVMADVVDYDNLETGEQRTGLYYSLLTMTGKVGAALAIGITYPMLDWIGFVAETGANSPETLNQLLYIYVGFPAFFMLSAAAVMWKFPLNREQQQLLRSRLALRDQHAHDEHPMSDAAAAVAQVGSAGGIADKPAD